MFPQALITVGYIPGTTNPADALTKIFRDPIEIINSQVWARDLRHQGGLGARRGGHLPSRSLPVQGPPL